MRPPPLCSLLLPLCVAILPAFAGDENAASNPLASETETTSRFSAAEIDLVEAWIKREVRDCPEHAASVAAERFLEELHRRYPADADRLAAPDFPATTHAPLLLRHVATQLTGPANRALRETVAVQRLAAVRANAGLDPKVSDASVLASIEAASSAQHRRLLEGRLEDEDLLLLLNRLAAFSSAPKPRAVAPKELTAGEILSEFSRRNQNGNAVARLQAYVLEGEMTDETGKPMHVTLFKMRPNRFRLAMRRDNATVSVLAGDGNRFWMQLPSQPARLVSAQDMGARRHLGEFIDPLLLSEDYRFERLPDDVGGARRLHRLAVMRGDGTSYVARIDAETFLADGRENEDGSVVTYSDHREVSGIMLAFREEIVGKEGGRQRFVISRLTPNPGLVSAFFEPPFSGQPNYLDFERAAAPAVATVQP